MRDHEPEIAAAGGGIAAIGTGDASYAAAFAAERHIAFPLLVDDDLVSFRAVRAGRGGLAQLLRPAVVTSGLRASSQGREHRQGRTGPHPLQLGATHVLRRGGEVRLAWVNRDFRDDAPLGAILAGLGAPG